MRCSRGQHGCGARFVLKRPPSEYVNQIKCPHCGSTHVLDCDKEYVKEHYNNPRRKRCRCDNIPFPHEAGTVVGCIDWVRPDDMTDEEFQSAYDSVIHTKRGSWA